MRYTKDIRCGEKTDRTFLEIWQDILMIDLPRAQALKQPNHAFSYSTEDRRIIDDLIEWLATLGYTVKHQRIVGRVVVDLTPPRALGR